MYVLYEYIIKYNCYILVLITVINKKGALKRGNLNGNLKQRTCM